MPRAAKTDWRSLWGILWRILIFGPILWTLGSALLVVVIAVFIGLPVYAVVAFYTGDWYWGVVALGAWAVVLRFRRPILRWTLEGIEYAGL